jgi:cobalt-zinc-cadmium efflux system protein
VLPDPAQSDDNPLRPEKHAVGMTDAEEEAQACYHPDDPPGTCVSKRSMRALRRVFVLTCLYLVLEVVGGWLSGSLALLADGFHMFADAGAIGISLFAQWYVHRPAPVYRTFGYQRMEVIAAFVNALGLIAMAVFILLESVERFRHPVSVQANLMLPIAIGGLLINIFSLRLLHADHQHNLNVKGAYLHVLSDLLGSLGAIAAGLFVWLFHWDIADAVLSGLIAALILGNAAGLLRDAANILLEGCPPHISIDAIRAAILDFDGVREVHHLHVWSINLQRIVLTAHLVVIPDAFGGEMLTRARDTLKHRFGLSHVTLQLETLSEAEA